jgi:ferredoxin--NADP+ reductase
MKIISKEIIVNASGVKIVKLSLFSPEISRKAKAGQFVVVMASEKGERIPLTIVDADIQAGSIKLIFQEAGLTTRVLGALNVSDNLYALVGPLGHPTEVKNYGKVILVGGGVGIAEIFPVARALKQSGNQVTSILGAKNKELLILETELQAVSDQVYIMTDDGSYGSQGFTTDKLEELLKQEKYDLIYSVGPIPMMKRVAQVSLKYNIKTLVSLNALMVDATGMCGCCRVTVSGQIKFTCVDGPDFDGHGVDWDELEKRNNVYNLQEKHICQHFPAG